jgi:hypothetical protein
LARRGGTASGVSRRACRSPGFGGSKPANDKEDFDSASDGAGGVVEGDNEEVEVRGENSLYIPSSTWLASGTIRLLSSRVLRYSEALRAVYS